MNRIKLTWFGERLTDELRRELSRRLAAACEVVRARAVKLVRISVFERVIVGVTKRGKNKYVAKLVRSKPGEPPRKETGRLQNSIQYEVNPSELTARVGTNVKYGAYLEQGAKNGRLTKRPWLSRAFRECQDRIERIFTRPFTR